MLWLNIGCGDKQIPGAYWQNVDSRELPGIDVVTDMGDLGMYCDNSVDHIYACHVLEHATHTQALEVLKEWARVLKPQHGVLRVCVPDMRTIWWLAHNGAHLGRLRGLIWGGQQYPENFHYCGWDFEELATDLRDCGFFNIVEYDPYGSPYHAHPPEYRDFSFMELNGSPCSLNVEAIAI